MISNGGFEVSARPTPANETSASAILAIGQYERARLTKASVATWGVRVAHDDPARQGFGAFVAAHGTLIGMAHAASVEDAGRHIGAEGISAGAMYTWR